jgi:hypothetical protein
MGMSIELQIIVKLDQSKLPHQLSPNYRTFQPSFASTNPWHTIEHQTPQIIYPSQEVQTRGTMRGCGLTSLVICINRKSCDRRKRNVTKE